MRVRSFFNGGVYIFYNVEICWIYVKKFSIVWIFFFFVLKISKIKNKIKIYFELDFGEGIVLDFS